MWIWPAERHNIDEIHTKIEYFAVIIITIY